MSGIDRIHVVSAAIIRDGRILLAQRAPDTSFPWAWCTPGGKVEPGEEPLDALRRELREELHIELAVLPELALRAQGKAWPIVFGAELNPPTVKRQLMVTCYRIEWRHVVGTPLLGDDTAGIGWFGARDLDCLELAPADNAGRQQLVRALGEPQ